jgi:hypothetical protein
MSAVDPRFETAGGLAHVGPHEATRCYDQGIMGIKGIKGQAIAIGQPDDVCSRLAKDCLKRNEILLCRVEVGP